MATIVLPKDQLEAFYNFLDIAVDHVLEAFDDEGDITAEVVYGVLKNLRRNDKGIAIVSKDSFNDLIEDREWRMAMESAGVDNWSGYTVAMELLEELNEEE